MMWFGSPNSTICHLGFLADGLYCLSIYFNLLLEPSFVAETGKLNAVLSRFPCS